MLRLIRPKSPFNRFIGIPIWPFQNKILSTSIIRQTVPPIIADQFDKSQATRIIMINCDMTPLNSLSYATSVTYSKSIYVNMLLLQLYSLTVYTKLSNIKKGCLRHRVFRTVPAKNTSSRCRKDTAYSKIPSELKLISSLAMLCVCQSALTKFQRIS